MDLHGPDLPNTAWPRNERPCIHMDGGEGLEPYEIYSIRLAEVKQRAALYKCTCYCCFDIRTFHRADRVVHRPDPKGKGHGDGKRRGPGLSSGPQGKRNEEQLDQEQKEEEYLNNIGNVFYPHVPGTDAEIEGVGTHPWHRLYLEGPISVQKGGGRKRSSRPVERAAKT